jgi:Flp pilus assembly protein TadB
MKNKIDLKELWNKQEATTPDTKELFDKIKRLKRNNLYALIATNVALLLTCAFIGFVWYYFQPEMITTKIGIVLAIVAMVLYLFAYNRMIPLLVHVGFDMNNNQCLQQLLKLKEKQLFLQTTILNIYCIMLSAGLFLYLIEYALRMELIWAVVSYAVTFLWIVVVWFDFRLRIIKKQQAKINGLINKLEVLGRQLTTNE